MGSNPTLANHFALCSLLFPFSPLSSSFFFLLSLLPPSSSFACVQCMLPCSPALLLSCCPAILLSYSPALLLSCTIIYTHTPPRADRHTHRCTNRLHTITNTNTSRGLFSLLSHSPSTRYDAALAPLLSLLYTLSSAFAVRRHAPPLFHDHSSSLSLCFSSPFPAASVRPFASDWDGLRRIRTS